MMKVFVFGSIILFASFGVDIAKASLCEPLSSFHIDCNICLCTVDGSEYSCTQNKCLPNGYDDFVREQTKEGFVVLKPKPISDTFEDDDFVLPNNVRKPRMPYWNDEIALENNREDLESPNVINFDDVLREDDAEDWENDDIVKEVLSQNDY